MVQSVYGSTLICGNNYPFYYNQENEKITIYFGIESVELHDEIDKIIGQKFGKTLGEETLYKMSVPLSNNCLIVKGEESKNGISGTQTIPIEYIITDYRENSKYTEMRLQFPELDYFIPSCSKLIISNEEFVFPRINDIIYDFDIKFRDSIVLVSFNRSAEMHKDMRTKALAETKSEVILKFPETDDQEYLIELYSATRRFFSFVCNRRNIGLRDASIIGNYPSKNYKNGEIVDELCYTKQELILSQKYLYPTEDSKQVAKTPISSLFSAKFKELFQLFFEEKVGDIALVNGNSIHHSFKYRNLINLEQSLHTVATFEYYVRTLLPQISSQETVEFFADIETVIDEYIGRTTGKKKRKAKSFKKSLRPQVSLEEKIIKTYEGYSSWKTLKPILSEWFGDDIDDLASAANLWRNELAHEKREYQPNINVIKAIRLVEHINYCIVLRQAGYNDEHIKSIVGSVLKRV